MRKPPMKGMRLSTETPIDPGTVLDIEVETARRGYAGSYRLRGEVMWSDYAGKTHCHEQGIQHCHSGTDQRKWQKFILKHLRNTDRTPKLHTFTNKA